LENLGSLGARIFDFVFKGQMDLISELNKISSNIFKIGEQLFMRPTTQNFPSMSTTPTKCGGGNCNHAEMKSTLRRLAINTIQERISKNILIF
jgi:hypothetical protein